MEKCKYTTIFSSEIKPLVSEDKDKYLAMASLIDVGDFVPDIDTEKNIDLLPIAFNAFVANRVNKNGDVIDTPTALEIYENLRTPRAKCLFAKIQMRVLLAIICTSS